MVFTVTKIDTKRLKSLFLLAAIILGFLFIVIFSTMYVSHIVTSHNVCGCVVPIPYLVALLAILGLFVGSLLAYFITVNTLKQKIALKELVRLSFKFLELDEQKVVDALFTHDGRLPQARFEKLTGLHKVKIHRILERLEVKGVLKRVSNGKTNEVVLDKEFAGLCDCDHI